jgi:FKBP-type peptidyl-prolyl cis-trans isomerase FklB
MKKYVFLFSLSLICLQLFAQKKKKGSVAVPAAAPVQLISQNDSLSYSIGIMVASFYKQQGVTNINDTLVNKAIRDELKGDSATLLNQQQANQVLMGFIEKAKADKAALSKKQGLAFLAENKTKPGVVTTADGLQYIVLQQGSGPKPVATDKVKCDYEGKLIDGTVFDSSIKQGHPIEFAVNGVIKGWTEALQLMNTGSKYRLFIPSELAYGDQQMGPDIKPGSTLIFDVTLIEIIK